MAVASRYPDLMPSEQIGTRIGMAYELQMAWLEPRLEEIGVGWSTFQLLTTVAAAGPGVSQAELARRLGVTPATFSESVFAHVKKGLLDQTLSASDRRVKTLRLTEPAKALVRKIKAAVSKAEAELVAGLSDDEVAAAAQALDRVIENLQRSLGHHD